MAAKKGRRSAKTFDIYRQHWNYPTQMLFGVGRIAELSAVCRQLAITRPLIVTDKGLKKVNFLKQIHSDLSAALPDTALFAGVQGNPVTANVTAGVKQFTDGGHDGVVAIGGGSALDVGKMVAFMSGQTRPLLDFVDEGDNWQRANEDGMAPVIAVPTTAGTGSEVGRSSVVTDEKASQKKVIFHPDMTPEVVISDPELTVALPPSITAAVGMDALSHALEAYCANGFHPMADGIALEAMRIINEWLPRAVFDGNDLDARAHMLAAASMGATAFQKGLGGMHAMSHPCSALFDSHHGMTNAIVMPYILEYNRDAIDAKMERLAQYLALDDDDFDAVMDWVLALRHEIAIPSSLTDVGVPEDAAAQLAPLAEADPLTGQNPCPITAADYRILYEQALEGSLD